MNGVARIRIGLYTRACRVHTFSVMPRSAAMLGLALAASSAGVVSAFTTTPFSLATSRHDRAQQQSLHMTQEV